MIAIKIRWRALAKCTRERIRAAKSTRPLRRMCAGRTSRFIYYVYEMFAGTFIITLGPNDCSIRKSIGWKRSHSLDVYVTC